MSVRLGNSIGKAISKALETPGGPPPPPPAAAPDMPPVRRDAPLQPEPSFAPPEPENTVYGSARLLYEAGQPLDLATTALSTSIVMGSDTLNGNKGYLWNLSKAPAHAITFGPSRKGGKGTSAIIPALLTYTAGSTFNTDPKAENAWAAAERLRQQGKRVVVMDPWNEVNRRYGSKAGVTEPLTRFNPLSSLDPASDDFADDVAALADALIIVPDTNNRHFDESAREMLAGLIAAAAQVTPGKASLRQVRELLSKPEDVLVKWIENFVKDQPDTLASRKLGRFATVNNEIRSIRSTALTQTAFLDSQTLLNAMETDEEAFDLAELATSRVALFLVLPVDRLETHGRWMRLVLTMTIRAIARQDTPPANPVLFLLDEMGTIGRLSMVENAYGLMAGLGIRLWGFFQDLVQLKGLYPNTWETFISNSSVIQILKAHDITTSQYVSEFLGNGTVNAKTGGWTYKQTRWQRGEQTRLRLDDEDRVRNYLRETKPHALLVSKPNYPDSDETYENIQITVGVAARQKERESRGMTADYKTDWVADEQYISRPLLDPDEVRRIDDVCCLLLIPGEFPVMQFRTVYYKHPLFVGLYRANPYFTKPVPLPEPEKEHA